MARIRMIAAVVAYTLAGNALADEILLEPEIAVMRFVQANFAKQSDPLRNNWLEISASGRNLLVREGGAIAISVTDAGIWSFRVVGQATTSRLPAPGKTTDAQRIQDVLSDPKVVDVLSIFNHSRTSTSPEIAVMAYQSKFETIEKHRFEDAEKKYLLGVVGEQLDTESSAVKDILLTESATAMIAKSSLETARLRQWEEQKNILQFANGGAVGGRISAADFSAMKTWPENIRALEVDGEDVTILEIPTDSGTLVLKCPGSQQQCTNTDGTSAPMTGTEGIFLPRNLGTVEIPL